MPDKRHRTRLPIAGIGDGEVVETGQKFSFEVRDFSSGGMQIGLLEGQTAGLGDTLQLKFDVRNLEDQSVAVAVKGKVRRIDMEDGVTICGVRLIEVTDAEEGDSFDQAYIERFFDMHG